MNPCQTFSFPTLETVAIYSWLPITWTLANLKLVLTQTKVDFPWIFFNTFAVISFSATRTLNNLNLSLTRSNFPSDHFYIGL